MVEDLQDRIPEVKENLERVGITGLRTIVRTKWKGHEYRFVPNFELTIDLSKRKKGVHMSRLIESITETLEEETKSLHPSLEELEKHILERLKKVHSYRRAEITMKTELVVPKKTPITKKETMETHDIWISVINDNRNYKKILRVEVLGNTVCPHSMEYAKGKAHIQRAIGILEIETDYKNSVELENMIDVVESSFSSKVYTLLKTEDERAVVNEMFSNPKFVEDVCREILSNAKSKFKNSKIRVKVISNESIHRHDVVAEASCRS